MKRRRESIENEEEDVKKLDQRYHKPTSFRKRWDSEYLLSLAQEENSFVAEYRLSPKAFYQLYEMLGSSLDVNQDMASRAMGRSGSAPITPMSRMAAGLIMLGGGRFMESMRTHGLSHSTVYDNFKKFVRAVNTCPSLAIVHDGSKASCIKKAAAFEKKSHLGLFKYNVGCTDGILIRMKAPSRLNGKTVLNQTSFYSGSKKAYGMNVQATCDADKKFTAISCKHTGSTNDCHAFETSHLKVINEALPSPFHTVNDPAYTLTQTVMIPYEGTKLHVHAPYKESFNFYLSQIRIIIECGFGELIGRFGIFWTNLGYDVDFVMEIVHCCCRLHNFCIDLKSPIICKEDAPGVARAALDSMGRLVDNGFRLVDMDVYPTATTPRIGNVLRDNILDYITDNKIIAIRDHHKLQDAKTTA